VQATSEKSRARFAKRKQFMPRERIALLLDRGAPFLELMPLAGYRMHDDKDGSSAGGGSVAGIGYVEGVRCIVSASNSAIKGGTVAPSGQRKGQRVQQIVMETSCRWCTWSNRVAPTFCTRPRSSCRAAAALPTRRACRHAASRRSPWCTVPRRRAAPTCPASPTTSSWLAQTRPRCFWPGRRS